MPNLNKNSAIKEATLKVRQEAYFRKCEEYDKLTLDELKALYDKPGKKNRIGGVYKLAMIEVVRKKMQEKAIADNQIVAEMPQVNTETVSELPQESSENTTE